jgi:hypothetical protein
MDPLQFTGGSVAQTACGVVKHQEYSPTPELLEGYAWPSYAGEAEAGRLVPWTSTAICDIKVPGVPIGPMSHLVRGTTWAGAELGAGYVRRQKAVERIFHRLQPQHEPSLLPSHKIAEPTAEDESHHEKKQPGSNTNEFQGHLGLLPSIVMS